MRTAFTATVAFVWLALPGVVASATVPADGMDRFTVERYLRLQERSAHGDQKAALVLGSYVAGLFSGLQHVNARVAPAARLYCAPSGLNPELREVLNFIDEALVLYRQSVVDAGVRPVRELLLEALRRRYPCD